MPNMDGVKTAKKQADLACKWDFIKIEGVVSTNEQPLVWLYLTHHLPISHQNLERIPIL